MNEYVIVTDSGADLSAEQVRELDVRVLPLCFTIQGRTFRDTPDHEDMGIEEFYRLVKEGELPTTNAVNLAQYKEELSPILAEGKDVLILSFSSALSATCQTAMMAVEELRAEFPDRKIFAVDTLSASLGQGLLVWYAALMRTGGENIETVRDWVEANRLRLCHWFTVDDLMHLKRGGRVSAATAVVGTMLQIKPVLHVDDAGRLVNMSKARGRKAALDALVAKVGETAVRPREQTMFISNTACREDAQYVADQIREKYGAAEIVIGNIGPVIGSHTGCGCVALFFMGNMR